MMKIGFFSILRRFSPVFMLFAALSVLTGCGDAKFKVSGEVTGSDNRKLVLERADFGGRWITVDSTRTDSKGSFSISAPSPASPDIYRLNSDGNYIYFPVDSLDNIKVETTDADFGKKFTLSGSDQAKLMAEFEQNLLKLDMNDEAKVKSFKEEVFNNYLIGSQGNILSYYVLTKVVGDKPLYDPSDTGDVKYFAAVATAFDQFRPSDPHGRVLKQVAMEAMRNKNRVEGRHKVIEAPETTLLDIELPDENGTVQKLSDIAKQGKPTVVVFSLMNDARSPEFNIALSELYKKYGGGINIYHVSNDADQYAWRDAAANLPWTTVFDSSGVRSKVLVRYNVTTLPSIFIYNRQGELADRADSFVELNKKLSSY